MLWPVKPKVVLAVVGVVLLAGAAYLLLREPPSFADRVKAVDTCAELDEVAADSRDPGGINPEAILDSLDNPDSARSKEFTEGIGDSVLVVLRGNELNC
jgi:hypothetical protein